jgi:hypothetical protein
MPVRQRTRSLVCSEKSTRVSHYRFAETIRHSLRNGFRLIPRSPGARDMTPYESEELTTLIERQGREFVVLWSPETAEHDPDYRELGRFPTREKALEFLAADG